MALNFELQKCKLSINYSCSCMCIFLISSCEDVSQPVLLSVALLSPLNLEEHVTDQHADAPRSRHAKSEREIKRERELNWI